jgi:hypothetical protein
MTLREHIHTIPVLEALRAPGHCPFCAMYRRVDADAVAFMMGPAYMDERVRAETNEAGFCAVHLETLYAAQNRLGLALLLHTRLRSAAAKRDYASERCYLCERINDTFKRYMDTFFYLWAREAEAAALIAALPRGFCLPHYAEMTKAAETALNKKELAAFTALAEGLQREAMKKLDEDLDWFIRKFDYRNANEPWRGAEDALARAMAMLGGRAV